ncbi:MAG TPA: hypothetical protein VGL42_12190 [Opitutaceae bacterium]|jgi:hypothetical protein
MTTIASTAKAVSFSVMASAGPGPNYVTVGYSLSGSGSEQTLVRAVGPTLAEFNVPRPLPDPVLSLFDDQFQLIASNSGWGGQARLADAFAATGAFALAPTSRDDALLETLSTGNYTVQAGSASGAAGLVLVELYDADHNQSTAHLSNLSVLAQVDTQGVSLYAGFVIVGTEPQPVLLRAVGPTLAHLGLAHALVAPQLTLLDGSGRAIATCAPWGKEPLPGPSPIQAEPAAATESVMAETGAFPLMENSRDAAMIVTLPPGQYSVEVSGAPGDRGYALFEYYEL